MKYKLQKQQLLRNLTVVDIFFETGLKIVLKNKILVKYETLYDQQKLLLRQVNREQQVYLHYEIGSYIQKQVKKYVMKTFLFPWKIRYNPK